MHIQSYAYKKYHICLSFLSLYLVFFLTPTTHDDWYYESGNTLHHLLTVSVPKWYQALNGRILGNSMVSITSANRPLRALVQALLVLGIWIFAVKLVRACKGADLLLFTGILLLPAQIYAQTYGWASGFFNYVPEVFLTLAMLYLFLSSQKKKHHLPFCVPALGLALCVQLFAENVTVMNMLIGCSLLVAGIVLHKKRFMILPAAGIGFLLGGAVMFFSPAYRSSSYYSASSNSLLDTILENYPTVSFFTLGYHYLATLLLTVSLLFLIAKAQKYQGKIIGTVLSILLLLCQCYFIAFHVILKDYLNLHGAILTNLIDFTVNVIYVLLVLFVIFQLIEDGRTRLTAAGMLVLAIAYAAPLLVVSPIGPRCFYSTYIYMFLGAFTVAQYAFAPVLAGRQIVTVETVISICAAALILLIQMKNYVVFIQRVQTIEQQMQYKSKTIALRQYPYPEYIWGADSQTVGVFYYYEQPNDITFTYTDY